MANFDLEKYKPVQDRIGEFYTDFPEGSILTELVKNEGPEVVFKAYCFRTPEEQRAGVVFAVGYAREIEGKSPVNRTSHLENCESSAVGRMLANAGYATAADRPSRSEMLKVARMQDEHDALLGYIREAGAKLGDGEVTTLRGEEVVVKEYVRSRWEDARERISAARELADIVERATGERFDQAA
jgi:hypothetical protein